MTEGLSLTALYIEGTKRFSWAANTLKGLPPFLETWAS